MSKSRFVRSTVSGFKFCFNTKIWFRMLMSFFEIISESSSASLNMRECIRDKYLLRRASQNPCAKWRFVVVDGLSNWTSWSLYLERKALCSRIWERSKFRDSQSELCCWLGGGWAFGAELGGEFEFGGDTEFGELKFWNMVLENSMKFTSST